MNKFKKALPLLLCAILLASCGDTQTETGTQNTDDTATAAVTEAVTEDTFDPFADLPEQDYGGYEFRIQLRPSDRWTSDQYVEETDGDIVNDAVFERNAAVGEKYNITIVAVPSTDEGWDISALNIVLAGDDAFDLIVPHGQAAFTYANEGILLDWDSELPYINLDGEWWDQDARNNFSMFNHLYVMTGDISYNSMGAANVMLFNKNLCSELDITYPYQDVLDGTWTFEKFDSLARLATYDMNGDGTMSMEYDRYGYITQKWVGPVQAFITSGLRVVSKDENDTPYLSFFSERTVEVFDRYFNLVDSDNAYLDTGSTSRSQDLIDMFQEGRSLFMDMNMSDVVLLRTMDVDFGIIPWPKYDESSEYCTNVDAGTNLFCVPITVSDAERTSVIIEALCKVGYKEVIPAFYDVALQGKTTRDDESAEMLDLIRSARIFDYGYYNHNCSGELAYTFALIAESKSSRDLTSWYAKREASSQKDLEKIIAMYEERE